MIVVIEVKSSRWGCQTKHSMVAWFHMCFAQIVNHFTLTRSRTRIIDIRKFEFFAYQGRNTFSWMQKFTLLDKSFQFALFCCPTVAKEMESNRIFAVEISHFRSVSHTKTFTAATAISFIGIDELKSFVETSFLVINGHAI